MQIVQVCWTRKTPSSAIGCWAPRLFRAMFGSFISMQTFLFLYYLTLICYYPHKVDAAIHGNVTDHEALLAFKSQISDDPFGFLASWNDSTAFCNWSGVTCQSQRVVILSVPHQKLSGRISPYIGNLTFLRVLNIPNNSFTHQIPPELGRLKKLEILYLQNNSIAGEIPANLSACANLQAIRAGQNMLQGKIPAEVGLLSKLEAFQVGQNFLIGGFPPTFGNLSSLVVIEVTSNALVGSVPSELGRLKNLRGFIFEDNRFSGTIPPSVFNISTLTMFSVAFNQIYGSIPSNIGNNLPYLEFFSIAENIINASVPTSISNLSNLGVFQVNGNKLSGEMPHLGNLNKLFDFTITYNQIGSGNTTDWGFISSLNNATELQVLGLNANNFGGTLPESFNNLSATLSDLYLDNNRITGGIPTGIGKFVNLGHLQMWSNRFTGTLPFGLGKLQSLHTLDLSSNSFIGEIPSSLGNLSMLNKLNLEKNGFHGNIPVSLGDCQDLIQLDLSYNNLSGEIPQQIFSLSSLSVVLGLSDNRFTGPIPSKIGNLKLLANFNVSNNLLSGEIPNTLGSCESLEYVSMQGNSLVGSIPSSLSSARGIKHLDLSRNNLSGQIPTFLVHFHLNYLNLSFNDFEGPLPKEGVFKNATAVFVNGNGKLCGGIPELKLPSCNIPRLKKRKRSSLSLRFIIPSVLGLVGLTSILGILLFCCLRRKRKESPSSPNIENSLLRISYQNLVNATDGFSSGRLIGMGGFGSVYKGNLEDGKIIAVKVLHLHRHGALKSFMSECKALRNIRHRNLVSVLSACSSTDYQGNDFKAMVYELMVNGSLEEWLQFSGPRFDAEPGKFLNLLQRVNIAIDVASALDYLHNQCQPQIVHCDIKPSNVLLDIEMTARVGDFGLARLLQQESDNLKTNYSSSIAIKGTVGYAPPEYGMGSEVSVLGDVYSYGILVLEMFIGKKPTDDIFHGGLNLHNFAKLAFPEKVNEIVDQVLLPQREDKETDTSFDNKLRSVGECLTSVIGIGICCSLETPGERMDMKSVATELRVIRDSLVRTKPTAIDPK